MSYQHPEAVFYGRDPEYAEPSGEPEADNPCWFCEEDIGDAAQVEVRGLTGRLHMAHVECARDTDTPVVHE